MALHLTIPLVVFVLVVLVILTEPMHEKWGLRSIIEVAERQYGYGN